MKKILIFAGLAVAMASCTSEEPAQVSDSYAIGFSTYVGKATRAGDVNTESLTSFAVYGGTEKGEFNGTAVTKQNGSWTYSPLQYWSEGAKYKFAAVAPAVNGASYDYASNALSVADYTPGDDDLIVASTNEIEGKSADNTAVALNFKHALSKVQFSFNGIEEGKTLSNVKLCAVKNKAALSVTYVNGVAPAWTLAEGSGEYEYAIDAEGKGVKYLLPQNLDAAKITYTYGDAEHTILVKTADVAAWEMGKAYNYNISLAAGTAIAFEVAVATWEETAGQTIKEVETKTITLEATASTRIRSDNATSTTSNDKTFEVKLTSDGKKFFGLLAFDLPEDIKKGSIVSAELAVVNTYFKSGDKNVNLYELTGLDYSQGANYATYGEACETIIADSKNIITSFVAKGKTNCAMTNGDLGEFQNVEYWKSYIDLTSFINGKDGGTQFTLLFANQAVNGDGLRFASPYAQDIESVNNNGTTDDKSDDYVEFTFKAADLVPQLVITYTKE